MRDESDHKDVPEQMTNESISTLDQHSEYIRPTDVIPGLTIRVPDLPVVLMNKQV